MSALGGLRGRRTLRPLTGWLGLYLLSWRLGLRALLRGDRSREALVRLLVPLDPIRYVELPATLAALDAREGDRVLDLASPKLVAALLARRGVRVTSVDASDEEIAAWKGLAGHLPELTLQTGDGRALPFPDASFDHAYSISVLEHIGEDGDIPALAELARVVRPGGRVVITLPHRPVLEEEWRDEPMYGAQEPVAGRYFFYRHYDRARLERLVDSVPQVRPVDVCFHALTPNLHRAYEDNFPRLVPLGPALGLLALHRTGPAGDVVSLTLERR